MYDLDYIKLSRNFDPKKYILATFYIESTLNDKEAAAAVATESSIGTWTKVGTMERQKFEKLAARVYEISLKHNRIKVAYPLDLFENGNLPQLLSSVAGNVFSLKEIMKLKLIDLKFPERYVKSFSGPKFGQTGVRKITGIYKRPLVGVIMKPKLGLSAAKHAKVAYDVFSAGADLVKDDENLTDQKFNPFKERVAKTLAVVKKVEKKSKTKKLAAFNVTAETSEMIKRAKFVKAKGGRCILVDIVTCGFSGVQSLRKADLGLIIHGHRAMHSAYTRMPHHGVSILVLTKLARLAGIDQFHTGTVVGKMEGGEKQVIELNKFLTSDFYGLKKVMPIASGGLHPALVSKLVKILGKDVIINFGGGVHGHPNGSKEGTLAAVQAVEATMAGVPLKKYAQNKNELNKALKFFK